MTPEADRYLHNADDHLERGRTMLSAQLNDDAGRAAYLAAFHAAQAFIFEVTSKILKSHKAVNIEFLRSTKDDPRFSLEDRRFLSRAYEFKAVADYDSGPITEVLPGHASAAVEAATIFVQTVRRCLTALQPK